MSYNQILNFPTATVEFHKGKLIYGLIEGKKTIVMQGRFHLYEGYSLQDVSYPVRIMKAFGIHSLLVSNASGAINLNFKKSELMLIEDHINLGVTKDLIRLSVGLELPKNPSWALLE